MRAFALLTVIAVLVMSSVVLVAAYYAPDQVSARHAEALARQAQAERLQPVDDVLAVGWRLLPLGFAAGLAGLGLLAVARRLALVRVAPNTPPLPYAGVVTGQYAPMTAMGLAGHHAAQLEAAKQPRLPDTLRTYAPRYIEGRQAAPQAAPAIASEPAHLLTSFSAPTFAALLQANAIGDGRLLLGYTADAPLVGSWKDLYSTAVGGVSGSGKTTTTRFLAAQSAMMGARFVILDPHAGAGDDSLAATLAPLAPSFIADPAADVPTMRAVIQRVTAELDERMRTGRKAPPLIVCVDEFTSLMRGPVGDDLAALLERIGQEGRKYGVFALLSGQIWTAERSGGSELRDSLASAFVHRLKPSQARLLVPDIDKAVARLPVGHAYLNRTNGDLLEVAIPLTTAADLEAVARRLPAPACDVGEAPRPFRPFTDFATNRPPAWTDSDGLGRSDGGNEPENRPETIDPTDRPRPTATDRPPLRVLKPLSLVDKARAVGVELSESDWQDLAALDSGQTPQAIAARETGTTEGRPYRRRRDDLMRLAEMIRTWPEGDEAQAADGD